MASRTPPRGGSTTRSSRSSSSGSRSSSRSGSRSGSSSNAQPLVFGGIGLAVVIALVIMMNRSGSKAATNMGGDPVPASPASSSAASSSTPARTPVPLAAAKSGKTPARAAPPLTADTLQQARDLLASAKSLCNEGVTARTAGDNGKAREKQGLAKDKLVALKALVAVQSLWQEEAQLEDWAQPAEYMTLESIYAEVGKLEKQVRMGGG